MCSKFVKKRNGTFVAFNSEKILNAIYKAFEEENYSKEEVREYSLKIVENILKDNNMDNVEKIQDRIEEILMKDYPQVAKSYILYREAKKYEKKYKRKYNFLTEDFLNNYKDVTPPLTEIGLFTFLRTYSRFLPELRRRENYLEACARTVDANISFIYQIKKELSIEEFKQYQKEAETLFDNMFFGRQYLSGRLFWIGGTKNVELYPSAIYNCSFTKIEKYRDIIEVMYLLTLGCGVGYRIFEEDIQNMENFRDIQIYHMEYEPLPKNDRLEYTEVSFENNNAIIKVGDSKIGWCLAIEKYFELMNYDLYKGIDKILFNYNSVRPYGEPLKTFGGRASGYEALKTIIEKIYRVIKKSKGKLKAIDCLDILGAIAQGIVVGGVRRSAMIALLENSQEDVKYAKSSLYTYDSENDKWVINKDIDHRVMSNNSIIYRYKPTYDELSKHIDIQRENGEPAIINGIEATRRYDKFTGINP